MTHRGYKIRGKPVEQLAIVSIRVDRVQSSYLFLVLFPIHVLLLVIAGASYVCAVVAVNKKNVFARGEYALVVVMGN